MTVYYVDASAWVKRYLQEAGTKWIGRFFAGTPVICCSGLGLVESSAALARKHKAGEIDAAVLSASVDRLNKDWTRFYEVELNAALPRNAARIVLNSALRGADAAHLASAGSVPIRLGSAANLVRNTSDRELGNAARNSESPCWFPRRKSRSLPTPPHS